MKSSELRKEFLDFFEKRGHTIVASSSLLPADQTSLFTCAGMQQFVPYLSGAVKPPYLRACSIQKCLRVDDIDEVGDNTHHTFFEMMGNWSFNDYFKRDAIAWALEFLVDVCKLSKNRIWVTIFSGSDNVPKDSESIKIWQEYGIPKQRIFEYGKEDNFWGPVTKTGPCGPCSEIFYDTTGKPCKKGKKCGPNCECKRFVEIWNLVFMEYNKKEDGSFEKMAGRNVDTGIGLERLVALLQGKESNFETDLFLPLIQEVERLSRKKYKEEKRRFRIIVDHIRTCCFLISEGILPSNLGRGYVLRMLLRRLFRHSKHLNLPANWYVVLIRKVSEIYGNQYPEIQDKEEEILSVIRSEEGKFAKSLKNGLLQFNRVLNSKLEKKELKIITGKEAFNLYQSYGFPIELVKEMSKENGFLVDEEGFKKALEEHRVISRAGAEKKFGGVGIDKIKDAEEKRKAICLHTATHLLHQALRTILGSSVHQMGSDITPERLRFDFSYSQKLTDEEIKQVEDIVNEKIEQGLDIEKQVMSLKKAIESGALAFFKEKYAEQVSVYIIKDRQGHSFSKEVCAGPHVKNTSELGKFKIIKQKSVGANLRRIRAVLR